MGYLISCLQNLVDLSVSRPADELANIIFRKLVALIDQDDATGIHFVVGIN